MKLRWAIPAILASVLTGVLVAQGQVPGVNSTLNSVFTLVYEASTSKPTYSATAVIATAAAPTDVCTITGSATKTIRVRRIIIGGTAAAIESVPISIIKRSTATSGGDGALLTKVPYDSSFAAATAVVESWTTNGTLGTAVGKVIDVFVPFANTTTGSNPAYTFEFGRFGSPIFLRGVAQELAVSLDGQVFGTGKVSCTVEWTEDNDS